MKGNFNCMLYAICLTNVYAINYCYLFDILNIIRINFFLIGAILQFIYLFIFQLHLRDSVFDFLELKSSILVQLNFD